MSAGSREPQNHRMRKENDSFAVSRNRIRRAGAGWPFLLSRFFLRILFKVFFRLKVSGAENVPREGGVLLACNHQSFFDPIIVSHGLKRPITFMARDTLFRNWLFGPMISRLNSFPVRRGKADVDAIHEAVQRLQWGWALLVFPEGERTRDGRIAKLRGGPAMLAHRANVPIVPAVIKGAFEAWPRHRKLFRFHRISIVFGRPIPPPPDGRRETQERILQELQQSLESLFEAF